MDLVDMRAFFYIVQKRSISAAAKALFISQPALSARLERLETELNTKLVIREKGHRNISLTPKGEEFYKIAEQWIEIENKANQFKEQCNSEKIRLVTTGSVQEYIVPQIMHQVMQSRYSPQIQLDSVNADEIGSYVASGRADVGLSVRLDDSFSSVVCIPLFEEVKYLLCPANTPLPEGEIHPSMLSPEYEVAVTTVSNKTKSWHNMWFSPIVEPYAKVNLNHFSYHYLDKPSCWTICPASIVTSLLESHPELTFRKLNPAPPNRVIYIIRPRVISSSMFDLIQLFESTIYDYAEKTPWLNAFPAEQITTAQRI